MEKKVESIIYNFARLLVFNKDANDDWLLFESKRKSKEMAKEITKLMNNRKI